MACVGWVLAITGYVANATQSAATNNGIITLYAWSPAVTLIVIYLILRFVYHYDQISDEVIRTLEARRNGQA